MCVGGLHPLTDTTAHGHQNQSRYGHTDHGRTDTPLNGFHFNSHIMEEEDADENSWIAVILRIVQHHCVAKIIGVDMSYGYVYSYGCSAITAVFEK